MPGDDKHYYFLLLLFGHILASLLHGMQVILFPKDLDVIVNIKNIFWESLYFIHSFNSLFSEHLLFPHRSPVTIKDDATSAAAELNDFGNLCTLLVSPLFSRP